MAKVNQEKLNKIWYKAASIPFSSKILSSVFSFVSQSRKKLYKLGILESEDAPIDSILSLSVENFLDRRLQTMVYRLGLARTPYEARQLIVHRHITVKGRVVTIPSYHVMRGEESEIDYRPGSPYANPDHPMRQDLRGRVVKVTTTGTSGTEPAISVSSSSLPPEVAEELVAEVVEEDVEIDEESGSESGETS